MRDTAGWRNSSFHGNACFTQIASSKIERSIGFDWFLFFRWVQFRSIAELTQTQPMNWVRLKFSSTGFDLLCRDIFSRQNIGRGFTFKKPTNGSKLILSKLRRDIWEWSKYIRHRRPKLTFGKSFDYWWFTQAYRVGRDCQMCVVLCYNLAFERSILRLYGV